MASPPSSTSQPPSLPGYTILDVAGHGGMGTVYRAQQAAPRRLVALKLLTGALTSPASLAAFRREAEVIAGLEHPHIVPLYDFGERDGQPYLVLRYLAGGSVAGRLRRGPLDLTAAARWVRAVAGALDFAHQRGLVHRDIKPSNILLDEAGNAYLTDFGIAGTLSAPGEAVPSGSAPYMSPEQGSGQAVDRRADIYSLAVTLFEMLTGQKPYTAETALGVIVRAISDPIPSARALNPAIPPAVDEVIAWGMAKDPGERPASAGEFSRRLDQALAAPNTPVRAQPGAATVIGPATVLAPSPVVAVPAARPASRGMLAWLAVALLAVCVGGTVLLGGGALAASLLGSRTPTPAPTRRTATATVPAILLPTPAGRLLSDDFSRPGSGFATGEDHDGGIAYTGGTLHFEVLTEGVEWLSFSGQVDAPDVSIEGDVEQVSGPGASEMAVICRYQDAKNYTALALSGAGDYAIWQKRAGERHSLVDWTPVPGLPASGPHHLAATCAGSELRLTVDGIPLEGATDPAPAGGDIGLLAGLRAAGELVVEFDNLEVRQPAP